MLWKSSKVTEITKIFQSWILHHVHHLNQFFMKLVFFLIFSFFVVIKRTRPSLGWVAAPLWCPVHVVSSIWTSICPCLLALGPDTEEPGCMFPPSTLWSSWLCQWHNVKSVSHRLQRELHCPDQTTEGNICLCATQETSRHVTSRHVLNRKD